MRIKCDETTLAGMTYGVELEYTGASRGKIANVIAGVLGGTAVYEGSHLSNWVVTAPDGRKWNVESDVSVTGSRNDFGGEVVTPVLTIEDMPTLQSVVRAMRAAGATTDSSCGGHVHVGARDMNAVQVRNLIKLFYKNEELIYKMCRVRPERVGRWCRAVDRNFIGKICDMSDPTMDKINAEWFWAEGHGRVMRTHDHYTSCRYRSLNLTNLWPEHNGSCKHTVEFRLFEGCGCASNGKLHSGLIRANVILSLLMVKKAMEAKAGSIKNRYEYDETCAKFYARVFLQNLGFIGEYTKNPREHFTKHLGGSTRTVWIGRRAVAETVPAVTDGAVAA